MDVAETLTKPYFTDGKLLAAFRRGGDRPSFEELLATYGPLVYSTAQRQTATSEDAHEVTSAVFLTFSNRARKLCKSTCIADWLFGTTALASRKVRPVSRLRALVSRCRFEWKRKWTLDQAILRLSKKQRRAVLLGAFLKRQNGFSPSALKSGLRKLERRRVTLEPLAPLPKGLSEEILNAIQANSGQKRTHDLARSVVRTLRWRMRCRRFYTIVLAYHLLLALVIAAFVAVDFQSGFSRSLSAFITLQVRLFAWATSDLPARDWNGTPALSADSIHSPRDLYKTTNLWRADFHFTPEQWKALQPRGVKPLPHSLLPDGLILLRNPAAPRSGLAGVLGYAYDWVRGDVTFGGAKFDGAAVRIKGNAGSLAGAKRSFKVDLNKYVKGRTLAGVDELTFNNLMWDHSCLSETLGYEFFREAGVPAPRTAFAWISTSVQNQWDRKPLGLYVMLEPIDAVFAAEQFGSRRTPIFKPVTYELFNDLGPDWSSYAEIYDLKTKATSSEKQRLIDFARLVTSGSEVEFAESLPKFLDLDEFARFLAGQVLITTYDGILTTGQNFYVYLDRRSNKFGFIPWDLDSAWGNFWIGKLPELERASIWHPWVGNNRFLERVMGHEEFKIIYRRRLEEQLDQLLSKERLRRRINELAPILREPLSVESAFRLSKFEQFIGAEPVQAPEGILSRILDRPVNPILDFVEARARSVRQQLDGKTHGLIIKTPAGQ
jgi:spore coat protein H